MSFWAMGTLCCGLGLVGARFGVPHNEGGFVWLITTPCWPLILVCHMNVLQYAEGIILACKLLFRVTFPLAEERVRDREGAGLFDSIQFVEMTEEAYRCGALVFEKKFDVGADAR